MTDAVIDLKIIASTAGAEAGLARVGKVAESELGAGGTLGKAGKEAESSLGGVGKTAEKAGKDAEKAAKDSSGAFKDLGKGADGLLSSFTGLSLGQGAVLAGFAAAGLVAHGVFEEYNKLHDSTVALNQALKDAGEKVTPQWTKALDDAQKSGENLGFEASATTQALANMTMAGLSQKQALAELPQVMDLARAKGLDLATATQVITKGVAGAARGLKEFGVVGLVALPTTTALISAHHSLSMQLQTVTEDQEKYLVAVDQYGGKSTQAQTAVLALTKAHETADFTQQKLNTTLSVAWVRTNNLAVIHDALTKKVGGQAVAATHNLGVEWDIVTSKFNAFAGQAIPVVEAGIATVLGALGTGISWIITNVFPVIGEIATVISDDIKAVAPYFETAFKIIVTIVSTYINVIVGIFKVEFAVISAIITGVIDVIKGIAGVVSGVFGVIGNIIAGVLAAPKAIIDGIITAINAVIGIIDAIQVHIHFGPVNMDWNGLHIPKIPMLYEGGVALGSAGGSLAVVGDQGQDEAIIPLPKNWRTGGSTPGTNSGGASGKPVVINQYLTTQATPDQINRAVLKGLRTSGVTAL
jgi:hypothetical protein